MKANAPPWWLQVRRKPFAGRGSGPLPQEWRGSYPVLADRPWPAQASVCSESGLCPDRYAALLARRPYCVDAGIPNRSAIRANGMVRRHIEGVLSLRGGARQIKRRRQQKRFVIIISWAGELRYPIPSYASAVLWQRDLPSLFTI